ncbi:molecular chaperone HscC [Granulosicoccus antarcticus]|uniref:Chaperone protein HscC n=1 Tax=Granulosicoccus antarcticus IMCC3135 TaxID=1192854 RepID=A0A2Z2NJQ9_9GAMM|nr:molecular chaperone HscC [Granulosicoccus antarcticus]ASJ71343.1 Chaperone protein HscC [Granulosicoccus antarcticus IMCC3135]
MTSAIVGMDLGTTNSACAVWKDGKVQMIPNRLGEMLTPSVVHIDNTDTASIGKTAREKLILQPDATTALFKRYMGTDRVIKLNRKKFTAPELSAFVLRSLKEDAENFLGESVEEAVVSVPAYFSDAQRKATVQAAGMVGLKVERLINEPTAAAMAYGLHNKPEHTQFMVIDLGGGTFDISIMEYFDGVLEVHASAGDNFLGGEDFLDILVQEYLARLNISKSSLNKSDLNKVYQQLELAKRRFNSADQVIVEPFLSDQHAPVSLSSEEFERLVQPLMQRIKRPIETALRDADLMPTDLDDVLLVGGATRMKVLRTTVARMFRRMPSANLDPDLVIVMGAAIQGGLKARDAALDDVVLTDVCPYSLGTGVQNPEDTKGKQGLLFDPIIERNSVIPISREKRYVSARDNQRSINIDVYQGESRLVQNNIKLGELKVNIPRDKAGNQAVDVRFSYDINGLLEVDIVVESTGSRMNSVIENAPGTLSAEELDSSLKKLATMKFHPRDQEENRALIARAERLYEGRLGDDRRDVITFLSQFESAIETQDEKIIEIVRSRFVLQIEEYEESYF